MKLVWCPDTASTAYIDAVKVLKAADTDDTDVAELVAAMAGGWNTQGIVEAWHPDSPVSTTLALSAAALRTGGRHFCVLPDQPTRALYLNSVGDGANVEVLVGEPEEVMARIPGVDFALVDFRRSDAERVLKAARIGGRGAVLVCKQMGDTRGYGGERWSGVLMEGSRVVRSAVLPVGGGVEIVHVGVGEGKSLSDYINSRWIKHVDRTTGEEHVFRRCS